MTVRWLRRALYCLFDTVLVLASAYLTRRITRWIWRQ